ncbi:MAG: AmmeMemoRadiSam system protein B [Pirellulaceae bacterium]|nr:AmmeMemoRadiSam system protein B [Pirellulaceae bacterium]MCU0978554.1 AmmeMemoRadiSam system protein B [Pirellulaceae bacterium]
MVSERRAAVAGTFYPREPDQLRGLVDTYLREAKLGECRPKALIVPHAGFVYSGPIAASAYAQIQPYRELIRRVVLVGPSHRAAFRGLVTTTADYFLTPLGQVAVDQEAVSRLSKFPQVAAWDTPYIGEHCLEVQLPFLQVVLTDFQIVPLLVGDAKLADVSEPLDALWGGDETLFVISSDLCHYQDYDFARHLDHRTTRAIENLRFEEIGPDEACGCRAIGGLLELARRHHLRATALDVRNSGDTAGPKNQVVGYGAYAFA